MFDTAPSLGSYQSHIMAFILDQTKWPWAIVRVDGNSYERRNGFIAIAKCRLTIGWRISFLINLCDFSCQSHHGPVLAKRRHSNLWQWTRRLFTSMSAPSLLVLKHQWTRWTLLHRHLPDGRLEELSNCSESRTTLWLQLYVNHDWL